MVEEDESPLLEIASHFTRPIDWAAIFELYCDGAFLRSVERMNQHYFVEGRGKSVDHYIDLLNAHGSLLDKQLGGSFVFVEEGDRLLVRAAEGEGGALNYEIYDPMGRTKAALEQDLAATSGFFKGCGDGLTDATSVRSMISDDQGLSGKDAAKTILHYFAKPYRVFVDTAPE